MKITEEKIKNFIEMMNRLAKRHDLKIDFDYTAHIGPSDPMFITIISSIKTPRKYAIKWNEMTSLTDAAVDIWFDYFGGAGNDFVEYARQDLELTKNIYRNMAMSHYGANPGCIPVIKNVIFNNPATIVFWADGTKTVVKCQGSDEFDPEKGLAMAISKKALGNQGNYYNVFNSLCSNVVEPLYNDDPLKPLRDAMEKFTTAFERGRHG